MWIAEPPEQKVGAHNAVGAVVSIAAVAVAYNAVVPERQNAVPPALDSEAQAAVVAEA